MTSSEPEGYRQVTDVGVLRAMAHPARLAILSRLQTEGPATATECAQVTGLSPSACSYHLRQLAKHGFVADAPPRGDGRERVWRALQRSWGFQSPEDESPDVIEAQNAVIESILAETNQRLGDYLTNSDLESREWRSAAWLTHAVLRVDAEELRDIAERINELIRPYRVTERAAEDAPSGARLAEIHLRMFPRAPRRSGPGPNEAAAGASALRRVKGDPATS
ncbi:helix-turn-helix domain-containing protein [Microtetraspora sp. NBRC 16547]|uniref:ArsR/SmtB family transcription factor n=1 Tax=Microtetraspora sp. NBRC 16547 TaxID=3030993 RepID=UPI0024A0DF03|nr:helix-turn-helix domain-containing protein [Microtetraspora sp. NBRC 16547]GLX02922.1 transcriptional regulator [Microtetraspora sp. NBRC 16547]